ncbi:hypothetical protein RhiirC2_858905 [Rhizophagus irregularis]|uniref:Uncharacterized protein n=1 Tax=Rhizophagus irregularis TaxID=588596 RepID=A0A2N1M227_9GLOM|nr:hypothetical protein RhiirC2_858905 [Rhizophagus irregularis]
MVKTANYTPNRADVCCEAAQEWNKIKNKNSTEIEDIIKQYLATPFNLLNTGNFTKCISPKERKIAELEQICNITTDPQIRNDMYIKINDLRTEISSNKDKIMKLKRNAKYVQDCRAKKLKMLTEDQEVVRYDGRGRPPILFKYPDLHDQIHNSVEFGSADAK